MSVTTSNFQCQSLKWREKSEPSDLIMTSDETDNLLANVDDGLTSLSWLQNLNMCMTRLGAPTPPTPPASPICFGFNYPATTTANVQKVHTTQSSACFSKSKGATSSDSGGPSSALKSVHTSRSVYGTSQPLNETSLVPSNIKIDTPKKKTVSVQNKHSGPKQSKKCTAQCTQPQHPFQDSVDYKMNGNIKPPYSYATLICMAMKANKNKMTLSSIYKWIKENFLYYRNADPSWQNSIRHNLSLNKCFIKIPRNKDEPGKGGFWKLDPIYADTLVDGIFKKRRPSQKPSINGETCGESTVFKKKCRKKHSSTPANSYIENAVVKETPPSSAESYSYKEKMVDASELATAVNSIEGNCTYTYMLQPSNLDCEQSNLVHGYSNEVCISNAVNNECIIESDGNDICWNAILTDADLNELVDPINYTDSVAQIVNPIENDIQNPSVAHAKTATAQLTAVEPHQLDLIATSGNLIEDPQLFYHSNQLHNISFNSHSSNVITATSNVVTCINDANLTSHWNEWDSYQSSTSVMQMDCANQNAELILSQIEHGHEQLAINDINVIHNDAAISYLTSSTPLLSSSSSTNSVVSKNANTLTSQDEVMAQSIEIHTQSPSNFDSNSTMQPWVECKVALDTAALELDSFSNIEQLQQY